jgi:hypothetical protein
VNAAQSGDTILVSAGTYNENVVISTSGITLLSTSGRAATTIAGVQAGPELGAIVLTPGVNNVTIGSATGGFTIQGINGNGPIEKAGIYLQGTHTNLDIVGNEVVANGDLGLVSEQVAIVDILIQGNIFSGQTFTGSSVDPGPFNPNQFLEGNNLPRQLVAIGSGGGSSDIRFLDNIVSGKAGAPLTNNPNTLFGNQLVTIDAGQLADPGQRLSRATPLAERLRFAPGRRYQHHRQ